MTSIKTRPQAPVAPATTPSGPIGTLGETDYDLPERLPFRMKRLLLGRPLVSASAGDEKLSKKLALGVLSSDCISSSAYGTEEMLIVLLAVFGLSGFHILMPLTGVVLVVLVLMTLSYREVVMVYTRAGGSYVVARENFGPRVAQIASVALMIDYIVTVAVQAAAATAAITTAASALDPYKLEMTVAMILVLAYGNLRGIREAGKTFALPTYLFVGAAGAMVVVGVIRAIAGDLPHYATDTPGMIGVSDSHHAILSGFAIFYLLKAFANGGASLTGLEAISNGVGALKDPAGPNARRTLSIMSVMLGSLVLGISFLAWQTHATPYSDGSPTVIGQVAHAAFGTSAFGHVCFVAVQAATALILFTGANTPFTGFPFLASFIAEDSFLPRQLTKRGHRLAFSNGIIVLTIAALALVLVVGSNVDALVPFYAIGVFTGFTMAGLGMARYHRTHRERNWRRKLAINLSGGLVSGLVVLVFAVVKFTEGAWLVVVLFPLGWFALLRLNRQYHAESRSLDLVTSLGAARTAAGGRGTGASSGYYPRHVVMVMVDRLDLAVMRGLRYAGSLRPTELRAVHIALDPVAARHLESDWIARGLSETVPLQIVHCADRRLIRAAGRVALQTVLDDRSEVTVLLPRRTFSRLSQRLLHDRSADHIAEALGRIPHVAATIVPFDTTLDAAAEQRLTRAHAADGNPAGAHVGSVHVDSVDVRSVDVDSVGSGAGTQTAAERNSGREAGGHGAGAQTVAGLSVGREGLTPSASPQPVASPVTSGSPSVSASTTAREVDHEITPMASVAERQRVTVDGVIGMVRTGSVGGRSLEVELHDGSGSVRLLFMGRTQIPGIEPGVEARVTGRAGMFGGRLAIANPRYELL